MADVSWPQLTDEDQIGTKVDPLMRKIPIIKLKEGQLIQDTNNIVQYLVAQKKFTGFLIHDLKMRAYAHFLSEWVERWLVWLVIYARWLRDENYSRFLGTLGKDIDKDKIKKSVDYTRNRACNIIKTTEVGSLSEHNYFQNLMENLEQIENCLCENSFITGQELKEIDISLFMCLQAFYDPSLYDERVLIMAYPSIRSWMKKIDLLTSTPHTRSPIIEKNKAKPVTPK